MSKSKSSPTPETPKLPDGILKSDLKYPNFSEFAKDDNYEDREFELWYTTRFGWCIPCLLISRASRRQRTSAPGTADRFYAVTLNGESVRIGKGPHVLAQVRVHVRAARKEALQKFLDTRKSGSIKANEIRDTISTRRARGVLRRDDLW